MSQESNSNQPLEFEVMEVMMALSEVPQREDLDTLEAALTTIMDEMQKAVSDKNHMNSAVTTSQAALKNAAPEMVRVLRKVTAFDGALNKLHALAEKTNDLEMSMYHQQIALIFEGFLEVFFKYISIFERLYKMIPSLGSTGFSSHRRTALEILTEVQRITEKQVPIRDAIRMQTLVVLATIARANSESNPQIN